MKGKVAILLSTYNGEKYVEEQIGSLLRQTYDNIEIFVRDDGSSDRTIEILKEFESKKQITLFAEDNRGFIDSFFSLLKHCDKADYYAFCDQDDVWLDTKVEMALKRLNAIDSATPALYFSDYDYYDANMTYQKTVKYKKTPSFINSLFDCVGLGITMVFNKKLRDIIADNIPKHSCGHDWWAYILCNAIGTVVHDSVSTVKYRRHGMTESGGGGGFIKFQLWRIKKFIINDYFKKIKKQIQEFENIYKDDLSAEDLEILRLFSLEKRSFLNSLKKAFYTRRLRVRVIDEVMLRAVFLLGFL